MAELDEFHIITDAGVYRQHHYATEQELERLAIAHAREVFTPNAFYLDVKQRLTNISFRTRITDGLLLDFSDGKHPKFWVVEYELATHDMESHVAPQLRGFLRALKDENTLRELGKTVYERINSDPEGRRRIKELFGDVPDIHYLIDDILHQKPGILVVMDEVGPEVQDVLLDVSNDLRIIQFVTFEQAGKLVHLVNPLHSLEDGKISESTESRFLHVPPIQPERTNHSGVGPQGESYQQGFSCPRSLGRPHQWQDKGTYWKCPVCKASKTKPRHLRSS